MVVKDYIELVEQYKKYRSIGREINNILLKYLSKKAVQVCGRNLAIMSGKTLVFQDEDESSVLMDHCIYDYYENGQNAIAAYMEAVPPAPGTDEAIVLRAMSESFYTLVQVSEIVEDVGVWADDLLDSRQYLIVDIGFSQTAVEGLVLATRLIPFTGFLMSSGAARPVDKECLRSIFAYLEQQFSSEDGKYLEIDAQRRPEMTAAILRCCLQQREDSPGIEYQDVEPSYVTSPVKAEPHVGRNTPCPCGSGKKFKKCCGT